MDGYCRSWDVRKLGSDRPDLLIRLLDDEELRKSATHFFHQLSKDFRKTGAAGLTRNDIVDQLKTYGHPEMVVGAGSAMALHGLRDLTHDIDVSVPSKVFDELHAEHGRPALTELRPGVHLFTIPGTVIDVHRSDGLVDGAAKMKGVNAKVQTPDALLTFYKKMNRPKDQPWIKKLVSQG